MVEPGRKFALKKPNDLKGRRLNTRRLNKKLFWAIFSIACCASFWSQFSALKVAIKKYNRYRERQAAFVPLKPPQKKDLERLEFDTWASSLPKSDRIVSKTTVMGTITSTGHMLKQYYKLENVHITGKTINIFHDDDFEVPEENWVDTIFNNGTNKKLPTVTMMRHAQNSKYVYLRWNYMHASKRQPKCKRWVERPTYLIQMQHSQNIWHVWNEGIMASFQTLRENGLLPLVQVDEHGHVTEYIDDLGCVDCPWEIDQNNLKQKQIEHCRKKKGVIEPTSCSPGTDEWCKPGVHSYYREDGPLLWLAKDMGVTKQWSHMFHAISTNISSVELNGDCRTWETLTDSCFKEIYIGKSNILSYYMPLYIDPEDEEIELARQWRSNATHAFKLLMKGSQHRAYISTSKKKPPPPWKEVWPDHMSDPWRRLFLGVGPEHVDALDTVLPDFGMARRAYMSQKEAEGLEELWKESAKLTQSLAKKDPQNHNRKVLKPTDGGLPSMLEKPRPVITYIWRDNYKRSVLNTHDILSYILLRYNVTLRVTTLQESVPEVMDALSHTDVVIGMHGAGWTNALFIKRGAASLQLIPYGWVGEDGATIRGSSYKSLLLASDSIYSEWVNERGDYAYMRRHDFKSLKLKGVHLEYSIHPQKSWGMPEGVRPGNHWIYQNTFVDMKSFTPVLDALLQKAGIRAMETA